LDLKPNIGVCSQEEARHSISKLRYVRFGQKANTPARTRYHQESPNPMNQTRTPKSSTPADARPALPNRLRIVGGRWRGVRISFPPLEALRPSPDRVRETLFNWLQSVVIDARCLDLFAGSGALGIEALSRGAASVTFVDREVRVKQHLEETLLRLDAQHATVHVAEALKFLNGAAQPFDIVFLDPPFASSLLGEVCEKLACARWLAPSAMVYVECPAGASLPRLPEGWTVYRSKRAGQVGYHLLRAASAVSR
jgi:16S rRNA (guanine966-N2)-methyltransferase